MTTHAKYGWAIGLIVAGIVGALPFRNTNPGSPGSKPVVAKSDDSSTGTETPDRPFVKKEKQPSVAENQIRSRMVNSRLLPDANRSLSQFDDIDSQTNSFGDSRKEFSNRSQIPKVVELVPKKLDRTELPGSGSPGLSDTDTIENNQANRGPVQLTDPPIQRSMPRDVGPYRMRKVNSSRFQSASQSQRSSKTNVPSTRQRQVVHYKLRDGDSLRSIAERYLGDADRFDEILADNQHILTNGENFLPVGQYITIIVQ